MFPYISSVSLENEPFEHFLIPSAMDEMLQSKCLDWLELNAPWNLTETDFYEQYEFSLIGIELPPSISFLSSKVTLDALRKSLSNIFGVQFSSSVEITAHKLVKGQTIRIHNDYIEGAETHRVLLQLNRGWPEENGGYLMLFSEPEPALEYEPKCINPKSGSIQGFAISPRSHHAVSTIHGGERFTIVYSFFKRNYSLPAS